MSGKSPRKNTKSPTALLSSLQPASPFKVVQEVRKARETAKNLGINFAPGTTPSEMKTQLDINQAIKGEKETREREGKALVASNPDLVRGITNRDRIAWLLFRALARGDFHHDFGEGVDTRDKIVASDANRFLEIAKLVSKKGTVWLRTKLLDNVGQNLFTLIAEKINTILPPELPAFAASPLSPEEDEIRKEGVVTGKFADENTLLKRIGLDWVALKAVLGDETKYKDGDVLPYTFAVPGIPGGRKYDIRAAPYRRGKRGDVNYKVNTAPIDALEMVTGGKKKVALIVDASGGFPLTDLLDRTLIQRGGGGEVYIIENIENGADSATKLTNIIEKPKEGSATLPPAPTLMFLRDKENTVNYPLWNYTGDQKSNIFSTLHIVLNRVSNTEVEANLLVKDESGKTVQSFSIGDISNTSNVKNATLYALAIILEKGLVEEALIYTLIKRMGDWCQALSLLDVDRVYTLSKGDGEPKETTLRALHVDTEIGVVTNDRILLAFCILLGLNVFYTTAMDIAKLVYFKNTLDLPEGPALASRFEMIRATLTPLATLNSNVATHAATIQTRQTAYVTKLTTSRLSDYIIHLRSLLSNLGRLRTGFDTMLEQLQSYDEVVKNETQTTLNRFNAANAFVSIQSKLTADIQYNTTVLDDLEADIYPNVKADKIRIQALQRRLDSGGRISKSVEVTEAKNILLDARADIRQLVGKTLNPLTGTTILRSSFSEVTPGSRQASNYEEILSVLPALQLVLNEPASGGQRGGGVGENIATALMALRGRTIRILPRNADMTDPEVTSTVNIYAIGDSYYDEKLMAYTVADELVVTNDDTSVFKTAFRGLEDAVPDPETLEPPPSPLPTDTAALNALTYIGYRYLLLLVDLALNDLDGIRQEETESQEAVVDPTTGKYFETGLFSPGTWTHTRLARIEELRDRLHTPSLAVALELFFTPPFRELVKQPATVASLTDNLMSIRASLLTLIQPFTSQSALAERTETAARESRLAAAASVPMQDEQLVGRFVLGLIASLSLSIPKDTESLGTAIRSAISGRVLEVLDPETVPAVIPKGVMATVPGLSEAIQSAVETWILKNKPPSYAASIPGIKAGINQGVLQYIQSLQATPQPQSNVSVSSSSGVLSGGGRRGLYARLRQRAGESPDSEL